MVRTRSVIVTAVVAFAALGVGVGVAIASGTGSEDGPSPAITGSDLDRASAAALAHVGGGAVTGTEVGDEESFYEVEVTRPDGTQVDVQLDESFAVVGDAEDLEDGAE